MELVFSYPKLKYGYNPPAIYKMTFDTGHFYIGSSKRVKTRLVLWRTQLRRLDFSSRIIKDILKSVKEVKFEIIEYVFEKARLQKETEYIRVHFDDPMLMNRSPTAFDNTGIKALPPHLVKQRKPIVKKPLKGKFVAPPDYIFPHSKKINQFDKSGNFICSHKSLAAAARSIGVNESTIQGHLKSIRKRGVSGFVFKLDGDDRPIIIQRKTIKIKSNPIIEFPSSNCKPIIDLNTGVFYYSAKEAAEHAGRKPKQLYKMLTGTIRNKTQYRYA